MQETQDTWVQFLGQEDPLEEGMGTHQSILAWHMVNLYIQSHKEK